MPSLLGQLANITTGFAKGLLPGGAQQQHHETSPTSTATTNPTSAPSHATGHDDIEDDEALLPAIRATKKRPADQEEGNLERARKRINAGKSEHERRLMGDYQVPKTAKPISVPTYSDEFDRDGIQSRRAGSTKMGGFKPINTLSGAPHASQVSARSGARLDGSDFYKGGRGLVSGTGQSKLTTARSAGGNVASNISYGVNGDGFSDSGRSAKKRKVHHSRTEPGLDKSDPVDLTDQDDEPAQRKQKPGSGIASRGLTPATSASTKMSESFGGPSHINTMDKMLNSRTKNPRKAKDPSRASQTSSQTPSLIEIDSNGDRGTGARYAPVTIDGGDEHVRSSVIPASKRRTIDQTGTRPPINLMKDLPGVGKAKVKPGSTADMQKVNDVMDAALAHNQRKERPVQGNFAGAGAPPKNAARSLDGNFHSYTSPGQRSQQQPRSGSPKLARKFQRDTEPTERTRQKATQRMMESSRHLAPRVSPIDESFGSDDPLQGGNTVGSQASRSVSPQKRDRKAGQKTLGSPSDIKQTVFKQFRKPGIRDDDAEWALEDTDGGPPESSIMPVYAFYATSAILTSGHTTSLRYDSHNNDLDLFNGNHPVIIPGKQRSVSIGKHEAHQVFHSNGSNKVYIRGSVTDVSNGHICLAFYDHNGVNWFVSMIGAATEDHATFKHEPAERMDRTFAKQAIDISDRARSVQAQATRSAKRSLQPPPSSPNAAASDEEEIRYEHESDQPKRQSVRMRMLGVDEENQQPTRRATRNGRQSEASPYFNTGEVRRSTRETKPVQKRSPTPEPERWTKIHKPKRWSQSVVYPSAGARRVTVEFGDLERLDEGQFLNDNIVSFALRRIEENMAPEYKDSVHFFNSFFYPSFTTKNGKKGFNYDAVKRWTKNKDIFSVPYIVVPICVDLHWFVAIICNLPHLSRKVAAAEEEYEPPEDITNLAEANQAEGDDDTVEVVRTEDPTVQSKDETGAMHSLTLSDRGSKSPPNPDVFEINEDGQADYANADNRVVEEQDIAGSRLGTAAGRKSKKKAAPPARKYDPDEPSIVMLDSFGNSHPTEVRNLKDYLQAEADAKRGMAFDRDVLKGITAKGIPEQTNFCDCGVYLIGYVEQFAAHPRNFVTKVLSKELDQQADFATFNPSAKRAEIREELLRLNKGLEDAHMAKKKQKKADQDAVGQSAKAEPTKQDKLVATPVISDFPKEVAPPVVSTSQASTGEQVRAQTNKSERQPFAAPASCTDTAEPSAENDADSLEVEPARPLQTRMDASVPLREVQQEQASPSEESSESESETSEDSADEMLDGNHDAEDGAGVRSATIAEAPRSHMHLLDDLEKKLEEDSQSVAVPDDYADGRAVAGHANRKVDVERAVTPRQEPRDIEPHHPHAQTEVPDSQEARPVPQSQTGLGKHIKFND